MRRASVIHDLQEQPCPTEYRPSQVRSHVPMKSNDVTPHMLHLNRLQPPPPKSSFWVITCFPAPVRFGKRSCPPSAAFYALVFPYTNLIVTHFGEQQTERHFRLQKQKKMTLQADLRDNPPCHARACEIQNCLSRNGLNDAKCQAHVLALYQCCEAFYREQGDSAVSASCPKADLLRLKKKQMAAQM
ncbi:hypothetical protein EV126DRAFT_415894 [Verticillium dahliae]|nr:hypothetical protein EV126DRAFT_415894 [Verticillium dahliae]